MTKHRDRYISGHAIKRQALSGVDLGAFDLVLLAPSWDRRCTSITDIKLQADTAIVLRFDLKDNRGLQVQHEKLIDNFAFQTASNVIPLSGDATALRSFWTKIWMTVTSLRTRKKTPWRVLIDLSTCPRFYSLGLLAGLFREGLAQTVSVLYAEGKYGTKPQPSTADYPFTVGHWEAEPVPFLLGNSRPTKKKHFVVSVGFEGRRTARVLAKEDPDRVSVLMPKPGVRPGYVTETWRRNKETIDEYCIAKERIVNAPAGDAISAWKKLTEAGLEEPENEEVLYLCCGTKPHSLAMALRAICLEYPTVLYNRPELHSFMDVFPTGVYWQYDLRDLSSFPTLQ